MHSQTLEYHEEKHLLCIVTRDHDSNEPVIYEAWYPIGRFPRSDYEHLYGKAAHTLSGSGHGVYAVDNPGFRPINFQLENGGKTLPADFKKFPIPCPRVRPGIETEYRNGAWRKLLKTGWRLA